MRNYCSIWCQSWWMQLNKWVHGPIWNQRSRSFIDLGPRPLRFNIFKLLFLRNRYAHWSKISCGASMGRDFSAFISWSHKRTCSQCKNVYIFPSFDEQIPDMRGKFPKSDKVSLWILLISQKCVFCEIFLLKQSLHMLNK